LAVDNSGYGTLILSETSGEVLRGERQVLLRREPERAVSRKAKRSQAAIDLPPESLALFERLRAWRGAEAKEQGVPAYVIFHDAALRENAVARPQSVDTPGTITGVGESKLAKYGTGILEVVAE